MPPPPTCHLLVLLPWANYLNSLYLSFLICNKGMVVIDLGGLNEIMPVENAQQTRITITVRYGPELGVRSCVRARGGAHLNLCVDTWCDAVAGECSWELGLGLRSWWPCKACCTASTVLCSGFFLTPGAGCKSQDNKLIVQRLETSSGQWESFLSF